MGRPSPLEVAGRAIVLKHVIVWALTAPPRDMLETMTSEWPQAEHDAFATESKEMREQFWSRLGTLEQALSPWELELSRSTILTMTESQQIDASWRVEAFQVLLWALGLIDELPGYDEQADHDLLKTFPPAEDYLGQATLIESERIERARDLAELWHWRARTRQLQEAENPFPEGPEMAAAGFHSYDDVARAAAKSARERGDLDELMGDDFVAFRKPYRELSPEEASIVGSITMERHFALNWLCGYAPNNAWDETPTDT